MWCHATVVVLREKGLLIRGLPGAGKSSLADRLIDQARLCGFFARLVGDDRIELRAHGGRLIARGHPAISGAIERRGSGIATVAWLDAVVLEGVVDLVASNDRLPDESRLNTEIAGIPLPILTVLTGSGASDQAGRVLDWLLK
jgi:HPr kinase/phosphorylase